MTAALQALWDRRYGEIRFRLVDLCSLWYMGIVGLLLPLFSFRVHDVAVHVFAHFLFVVLALETLRAHHRHPQERLLRLLRIFYPAFVIIYGFVEMGDIQLALYGTYWASGYLAAADHAIFGVYPTVWARAHATPILDEVMSFFHLAYFVVPFLMVIPLLVRGKYEEVLASASLVLLTYTVTYTLFFLIPAVNPQQIPELSHDGTRVGGYVFGAIERAVQGHRGLLVGACFPSAHVSGSAAWALAGLRYARRVGYVIVVLTIGTAVATVFLGFHHAVDPVAGFLVAAACYRGGLAVLKRRGEDPLTVEQPQTSVVLTPSSEVG